MNLISQAEYARRLGVSRPAVSQWRKAGRIVLQGDLVDVEASDELLKKYRVGGLPTAKGEMKTVKRARSVTQLNTERVSLTCAEILERLAALDYTQAFDWSAAAQDQRARLAAQCIGWEAVTSDARDDGHHGGYQLRINGNVAAGFGFELGALDVLIECRDELAPLDPGDESAVRQDLLPLLARPFHEYDKKR